MTSKSITLSITEDKFDIMANRMIEQSKKREIKTGKGKKVGLSMARQMLSQSMFDRSYESLKPLFKEQPKKTNEIKSVYILCYGSDAVLAIDGEFNSCLAPGTDSQISFKTLESMAESASRSKDESFERSQIITLPVVLGDEWEYEDIILLAGYMGVFLNEPSIFELVSDCEAKLSIDNEVVSFNMPIDWMDVFENNAIAMDYSTEIEEHLANLGEIVIWDTFIGNDIENTYFTFGDLANAEYNEFDGSWMIHVNETTLLLRTI